MPPTSYFIMPPTHIDYINLTTGSYYIRSSPVTKKLLSPIQPSIINYYLFTYLYYCYLIKI